MTREEAFEELESTVGRYLLRENNENRFADIEHWRGILSAIKGDTNSTNLTADDWNANEIKVLKFMVKCAYAMIDCVDESDGYFGDFEKNDMFRLVSKLGIEDVI